MPLIDSTHQWWDLLDLAFGVMRIIRFPTVAGSWAGGGLALGAFPLLALWNIGADTWNFGSGWSVSLIFSAAISAATGVFLSSSQGVRRPNVIGRYRGSDLVAMAYPISVVIPLTAASSGDVFFAESALWVRLLVPILLAVIVGLIPFGILGLARPSQGFRVAAWVWSAATLLFIPAFGMGLVFLPLAITSFLAEENHRLEPPDLLAA